MHMTPNRWMLSLLFLKSIPFRKFSKYLKSIGIDGVAYRSTRMKLKGLYGTCLTLFEKDDATFIPGSMEVYVQKNEIYQLLKKY